MYKRVLIFGFYTITPVHPGSGAELSVVDLPIQRERHTGFPVIWGQSIKGVLRASYSGSDDEKNLVFGPPTERAHEHAGAISVGDAKLLLFPVRSLKGVFSYVTSPMVIERFIEDLKLAKAVEGESDELHELIEKLTNVVNNIKSIKEGMALAGNVVRIGDKVVLEDVKLKVNGEIPNELIQVIKILFGEDIKKKIKGRLVVVDDNTFRNFVELTTEVVARVKIDSEKGTVATGGLWYEEFLPRDTLLYSVILVGDPRNSSGNAEDISRKLSNFNGGYLQIGGDETIGKGFVRVFVFGGVGNAKDTGAEEG